MITLSSDFGAPYPAAMRGVILQRTDTRVIDIAHDFPRQDIRTAAFWLNEILPWFPPAVHCAVVDPGVGTNRDAIAARVADHILIGPDNGLLRPVARTIATQSSASIEWFKLEWEPESNTFHGRDVFAPAAAEVHETTLELLQENGKASVTSPNVDLQLPTPEVEQRRITGEVLVVDGFGNAITNIPDSILKNQIDSCDRLKINGITVPYVSSFAEVDKNKPLVTIGSHGNAELAVNQGRGDIAFDVTVGDKVVIEKEST